MLVKLFIFTIFTFKITVKFILNLLGFINYNIAITNIKINKIEPNKHSNIACSSLFFVQNKFILILFSSIK